jgi:hypothetical protein
MSTIAMMANRSACLSRADEPATSGVTGVTEAFQRASLAAELAEKCGFEQVLVVYAEARFSPDFTWRFHDVSMVTAESASRRTEHGLES